MFMKRIIKSIFHFLGYEVRRKESAISLNFSSTYKYEQELAYWIGRYNEENHIFGNAHYKQIMLGMAKETSDIFLKDKVVVDFGCGPRGSLVWTTAPKMRIGVDVLIDKYYDYFSEEMVRDEYFYIKSTEEHIPIPSGIVDIIFTMNSMDHTDNLERMLNELFRVLKIGGEFIGSFNLNEPATPCEPQTLTLEILRELLFPQLEIQHQVIALNGNYMKPKRDTYDCFFDENAKRATETDKSIIWIRGRKK